MNNYDLLLAAGNTQKKFTNSSNKKAISTNVTTSYRSVLQETIAEVSRPTSRNTNNSVFTNSQVIRGDANDDGVVDKNDLDLLQRHLIELGSVKNFNAADMDGDGKITVTDVSQLSLMLHEQKSKNNSVLKGDANSDGKINQRDLDLISSRAVNAYTGDKFDTTAADMNGDGEIDSIDVSKVMQLVKKHEASVKTLQGDSNGDGVVNEADHQNIKDYLSGKNSSEDFIRKNSDVNGDGEVDEKDLQGVRNILDGRPVDWDKSRLGDANGDGKINAKDAELIHLRSIGLGQNFKFDMNYADFNNDGEITPTDVARITQLVDAKEASVRTLQGDSNGDGKVDETDYQNIKNYLDGRESTEDFIRKNSDINGDGEVDKADLRGVRNILDGRKIDWDESKRLLGDVNGDGKIDVMEDSVTIANYVNGAIQKKDFYWDNADVNHDGKIDLEDSVRIKKFYNGEISSLDQEITKVNPPFEKAVITADTDVYSDFFFIDKNNQVINGDIVRVIGKSSDGTAFEIAFPNAEGGESTGWVSVNNLEEYVPPPPPPVPPDNVYVRPTKTSDKGIELIKGFEGFRSEAYILPGENEYTIGYGHKSADIKEGMTITLAQAEEYLRQDLINAENYVKKYCSHLNLNQNQFDALVSFTFNCGPKNLNKLLHGESGKENRPLEELPEHMPFYRLDGTKKISNGLVNRRAAEVALFNTPVDYNIVPPPVPDPITIVAPPFTSGRAKFKEEVYKDFNLKDKVTANEQVFAGETVRVTGMSSDGKALRIVYSSIYGGEKERWISADAIEEVKVPQKLQSLIDHWTGIGKWTNGYSRSKNAEKYLNSFATQCKEFAAYIFNILYDTGYVGSGSTSSNYYNWRLNNISSSIYQVAEVPQSTGLTASNAQDLFSQAQSGDFIQMKRGHGGAHSAILTKKNDDGVWFLEANADGKNTIQEKFYSWDDLVKITSKGNKYNVAMSIYRKK